MLARHVSDLSANAGKTFQALSGAICLVRYSAQVADIVAVTQLFNAIVAHTHSTIRSPQEVREINRILFGYQPMA
jgi:hypothetical protein